MSEPFHRYTNRRQIERDTAIPVLDAPAVTVRLRREVPRLSAMPFMRLALGIAAISALLIESLY